MARILLYIQMAFCLNVNGVISQDFSKLKKIASSHPDSAIAILSMSLINEDDSIRAGIYQLLGNAHFFKSSYDSAIDNYTKSNNLLDSTTLYGKATMAKNFNNIGVAYNYQADLERAYENHRHAMVLREALNDPFITSSYNNMGLILHDLSNLEEALKYYRKAFDKKLSLKQYTKLSTTTRNIARVHSDLGRHDSSTHYLRMNLLHLDTIPNKRELASTLTNLGFNLGELGQIEEGINVSRRGFTLKKELNDKYGLINSALNLSVLYRRKEQYEKSEIYMDSLEMIIGSIDNYQSAWRIFKSRAYNNNALGNNELAYSYMLKAFDFQDSVSNANNKKTIQDIETKYQTKKKEDEIAYLTADNKIKDLQAKQDAQTRLILIIVLIALLVIAVLFYSRFRNKAKINELLDVKNQELANLNKTKDRLFSIISHDLKSPLSSFHTITKSLTDNWEQLHKEQLRSFVESLRDSSANVRDMMENLLKWALMQTDQLGHKSENVNLVEVLERVQNQLHNVSELKKIVIKKNLEKGTDIKADSQFVEIVLRNILSNALKFSSIGGEIAITIQNADSKQIIAIKDHGVGMNQLQIDQLIRGEILASDIQNSSEKGTGLGLTLSKELMDKMGAELSVESEKSKGTTFKLTFDQAA